MSADPERYNKLSLENKKDSHFRRITKKAIPENMRKPMVQNIDCSVVTVL
jgi:hypothetical protein